MNNKIFHVSDIINDSSGKAIIVGVPINHKPIIIGDIFILKYDINRSLQDIMNNIPPPDPTNIVDIHLTIIEIDCIRRKFSELSPGYTGGITLHGYGLDVIYPKFFLTT